MANFRPREPLVPVTIQITRAAYARLTEAASSQGYVPSGYARMLFDAAYAARIGHERGAPIDDAELDEQVKLVFALAGQASVEAISKATGVPASRVEQILDGFLAVAGDSKPKAKAKAKGRKG